MEGKVRNDGEPDFIPELEVDVTLLIKVDTTEKPVMLKKTLTYVDVPVGDFNVGVFISPSDVSKLTVQKKKQEEGGDGDLSQSLIGFAIEARFAGNVCTKATDRQPLEYVFDNAIKKKLSAKWWLSSLSANGAKLLSIDETPFAPYYYPHFPRTKTLYGGHDSSSASSSSSTFSSSTSTDSDTEISSDDTSAAGTTSSSRTGTTRTSSSSAK